MGALPKPQTASLPLIVSLVGATGTGKSDTALDLVEGLSSRGVRAEIIGADAMQLYEGMDIGTAKVPVEQRRGVPHHLLDVWEVSKEASVADYQALARAQILECQSRGVVPVLVGGSGLYVSSVLYEFEFPGTDKSIRAELEARVEAEGIDSLLHELQEKDTLAYAAIDPQNHRRVIRALEVITITGKPFGAGLDAEHRPWQESLLLHGLREERDLLVERLDRRVERMWDEGLIEEVELLIPRGIEAGVTASRAIGYQQALGQIHGVMTRDEAVAETQSLTRRYARRQVSWFGRDSRIAWHASQDSARVAVILDDVLRALESA